MSSLHFFDADKTDLNAVESRNLRLALDRCDGGANHLRSVFVDEAGPCHLRSVFTAEPKEPTHLRSVFLH
jgi:hypothetical protein